MNVDEINDISTKLLGLALHNNYTESAIILMNKSLNHAALKLHFLFVHVDHTICHDDQARAKYLISLFPWQT